VPWMKIDDTLHCHKKAMKAGVEAMGLWVLAGSWSSDQLTDGFVPECMATRWAPNATELAARLVTAGLWSVGECDDDAGWWFHQWEERNPTRQEVVKVRDEARERMRKTRGQRRTKPVRPNFARTASEVQEKFALPVPVPVVPNGTTKDSLRSSSAATAKRGQRLPNDWEPEPNLVEQIKNEVPNVDICAQHRRFVDYWIAQPGQKGVKLDWSATWRNWMRKADESNHAQIPAIRRSTSDAGVAAIQALKTRFEPGAEQKAIN